MIGRTHDLGAFTALMIVLVLLPSLPQISLLTALVAFGANFVGGLFPDIDQPTSDFWDNFRLGPFLAKIICPVLGGHRHISHSIFGVLLIGAGGKLLTLLLAPIILIDLNLVWASFMIGVISHLVLDFFTREGLPLLWPLMWKFGFPPFRFMRIPTGGFREKFVVFPGLLLLNMYLFYTNQEKLLVFLHQYIH